MTIFSYLLKVFTCISNISYVKKHSQHPYIQNNKISLSLLLGNLCVRLDQVLTSEVQQ